jgi:predicted nucleic acid-binding protein
MTRIVVDTGPLVAYFNRRDRWHRWVADQMVALNPPLVTSIRLWQADDTAPQ